MKEGQSMIKIDSVTKNFDTVRSLNNVSLQIENSSIFGLIGSNGSGKSTLLRILCGVYRQDNGDVLYDGIPVYEHTDVKRNVVYLLQRDAEAGVHHPRHRGSDKISAV